MKKQSKNIKKKENSGPLYDSVTIMPLLDYVMKNVSKDDDARKALYDWDGLRAERKQPKK